MSFSMEVEPMPSLPEEDKENTRSININLNSNSNLNSERNDESNITRIVEENQIDKRFLMTSTIHESPSRQKREDDGVLSHSSNFPSEEHITTEVQSPTKSPTKLRRRRSFLSSLPVAEADIDLGDACAITTVQTSAIPISDVYHTSLERNRSSSFLELQRSSSRSLHSMLQDSEHDDDDDDDDYEEPVNHSKRPCLLSVQCYKASKSIKLGMTLQNIHGQLKITGIAADSPLRPSPLRVGDRIVSLDDHNPCSHWTAQEAMTYLQEKGSGHINIVAQNSHGDPFKAETAMDKHTPSQKLGITFTNDDPEKGGRLKIEKVEASSSNGMLLLGGGDGSILREGDYVEKINHIDCSQKDASVVHEWITNTKERVTILVHYPDSAEIITIRESIYRWSSRQLLSEFPDDMDDLSDQFCVEASENFSTKGLYRSFSSISSSFKKKKNNKKYHRRSSNNSSIVYNDPSNHSTAYLNATNKSMAQDRIRPGYLSFRFYKPESVAPRNSTGKTTAFAKSNMGVDIERKDSKLIIVHVYGQGTSRGGLLAGSPFRPGHELISINGKPCGSWKKEKAESYFEKLHGDVTMIVCDPSGCPFHLLAMAYRPSPRAAIGVAFRGHSNQHLLKINRIRPDSIFNTSVISVDDEVLEINHVPCLNFRSKEAVKLIRRPNESVSILVKASGYSGVVLMGRRGKRLRMRRILFDRNTKLQDLSAEQKEEQSEERQGIAMSVFSCAFAVAAMVIVF